MLNLIKSLSVFLIFASSQAAWAGTCERVNCDCASIPSDFFQQSCFAHEALLHQSCLSGADNVKGYCALHGSNAFPVALDLNTQKTQASADVDSSNRQVAQLYWSIRQDAAFVKNASQSADFKSAAAVIKLSRLNLDNLFETQKSVAEAWITRGKEKKARRAWKDYSEDTIELADFWNTYLNEVSAGAQNNSKNTAYLNFNQMLAEFVAAIYEQAGYAFAGAEKYRPAAEAWKSASGISANSLGLLVLQNSELGAFEKYKSQTTSRLHRATLYWLKGSKEDDPSKKVQEAIEFASDKLLQEILADSDGTANK